MSKRNKIFHKPDENIPSEEDILNYLKEDSFGKKTTEEEKRSSAPSSSMVSESKSSATTGSGEKKNKKRHELEKAMLSDPLVSDAVEGYALLKDKEKANTFINDINKNIFNQTKRKAEQSPFLRIAALLVIIFMISGSGLFIYNKFSNDEIAIITKEEKPMASTVTKDTIAKVGVDSIAQLAIKTEEEREEVRKDELSIVTPKPEATGGFISSERPSGPVINENIAADRTSNGFPVIAEDKAFEKKEIQVSPVNKSNVQSDTVVVFPKDQLAVNRLEETNSMDDVDSKVRKEMSKKTKQKSSTYYAPSMSKADAELKDDVSGKTEKRNSMQDGIALYNQNKYIEARIAFAQAAKSNPSDQEAKWYLALTDVKVGKKKEAIKLLKELSKPGNPYSD
ncbi:MAG TPA: tetratricopeptide repeat protein, partial [Cytophagaceae bacterium]|nr:tetratricopeptide repeat protein [Cytophagaceae bacterium]